MSWKKFLIILSINPLLCYLLQETEWSVIKWFWTGMYTISALLVLIAVLDCFAKIFNKKPLAEIAIKSFRQNSLSLPQYALSISVMAYSMAWVQQLGAPWISFLMLLSFSGSLFLHVVYHRHTRFFNSSQAE